MNFLSKVMGKLSISISFDPLLLPTPFFTRLCPSVVFLGDLLFVFCYSDVYRLRIQNYRVSLPTPLLYSRSAGNELTKR